MTAGVTLFKGFFTICVWISPISILVDARSGSGSSNENLHKYQVFRIPQGGGDSDSSIDSGINGIADSTNTKKYFDGSNTAQSPSNSNTGISNAVEHSSPPPSSMNQQSFHQYGRHVHMTRLEERAILGRAVLTTPHRRMPAIRIAPGPRPPFISPQNPGPVMQATPVFVTKFSLCESLGCALRDLRVIDQFSTTPNAVAHHVGRYSGPAFLARSNCVIVNVGHVRAIVMRNQVLIFLPEAIGSNNHGEHNIGLSSPSSSSSMSGTDAGAGAGSESHRQLKTQNIMMTIEKLVEALVTHLNSIYHSSHHLMFDDDGNSNSNGNGIGNGKHQDTEMKLTSKDGTSMGQHWGSGWAVSGNARSGSMASSAEWIPSSSSMVQKRNIPGSKNYRKKNKWRNNRKQKKKEQQNQSSAFSTAGAPLAPAPPFELVVIEALLGHVCSHESTKVAILIQNAKHILDGITDGFSDSTVDGNGDNNKNSNSNADDKRGKKKDAFIEMQAKLGELLPLKNKVDLLEAKCAEVAGAIAEVLKNDEDMAAMRLSEINDDIILDGDPQNLHVEVELLFEDYLLQMDEVLLSLRAVQSSVTNTEEVVEIELDLLRNRIMRYEMLLELSGLVVGVAAAVTGAFGMNLINHFEEHPYMFYQVSAILLLLMGAMGFTVLKKLSNDNIL